MPGKNFRRVNSCFDCVHKTGGVNRYESVCNIDYTLITNGSPMPFETVCDEFEQRIWPEQQVSAGFKMGLKSAKDFYQDLMDQRADDDKIYIEDGYLVINYAYEYSITLDRIKRPTDILGWVLHLSGKSWMTKERIENFILKCAEANNTNYNCG